MTDQNPNTLESNKLDPGEVLSQAAALARHLQSSGVSFLPAANEDAVRQWAEHFQPAEPTSPPKQDASAKTVAAQNAPTANSTNPATPTAPVTPTSPGSSKPANSKPARSAPKIVSDEISVSYQGAPLAQADRTAQLELLSQQVAQCTRCDKLASCRTNTVFGEGSEAPRVAFFGEGPGADEDRTGRPFVGKAGQLLTKMIEACKFQREDVYILNSVKCRPPGNRNPDPEELSNCREYFEKQFQILRPEYIVCLGAISSQTLLNSKLSVGRLRGKFHRYYDSKVLVTYHPAYLLRNPAAKKAAWQDLQLMLRDAGLL